MHELLKTDYLLRIIIKSFKECFLPYDHLWSYQDLNKEINLEEQIDLYIETVYQNSTEILNAKVKFVVLLKQRLQDYKISVFVKSFEQTAPTPHPAKEEGIRLV